MTAGAEVTTQGSGDPADRALPSGSSETDSTDSSDDRLFDRVKTAAAMLAVLGIVIRATIHAGQPLSNADTWFHLRIGQEFWGSWSLWHPGGLTTFATNPWLPTQWSTEMLMAKVDDWFGLAGVAWLFGLFFAVFVLLVYYLVRREAEPLAAALTTGMVFIACSDEISARPQVISLIGLVVTVLAWRRTQVDLRARWWLIPATWIWATAHGMWTTGVIIGLACVVGMLLDHRHDRARVLRLGLVPVLSFAAALVTPVGPGLLKTQFVVSARSSLISEWAPTSFRAIPALAAAVLVGVVLMLWARRTTAADWSSLFMLAVAAGWILFVVRLVGFGAVVAAPMFAAALGDVLPRRRFDTARFERLVLVVGTVVVLGVLAVVVPHTAKRPGGVPDAFEPRLAALPAQTVVFADAPIGSWLTWQYPSLDPVMDGMFDAYPLPYLQSLSSAYQLGPGWQGTVRRTGASVAILPRTSALAAAMRSQLGWHRAAVDGQYEYLTAAP